MAYFAVRLDICLLEDTGKNRPVACEGHLLSLVAVRQNRPHALLSGCATLFFAVETTDTGKGAIDLNSRGSCAGQISMRRTWLQGMKTSNIDWTNDKRAAVLVLAIKLSSSNRELSSTTKRQLRLATVLLLVFERIKRFTAITVSGTWFAHWRCGRHPEVASHLVLAHCRSGGSGTRSALMLYVHTGACLSGKRRFHAKHLLA